MKKNWVLRMRDGKEYQMDERQITLIDQTNNAGGGFVRFDNLAINTKYVERYWKMPEDEPFLQRDEPEMSEERKAENLARLKVMLKEKGLNV